ADGARAVSPGHRLEQHVDRGPSEGHLRRLLELKAIVFDHQMDVWRGEVWPGTRLSRGAASLTGRAQCRATTCPSRGTAWGALCVTTRIGASSPAGIPRRTVRMAPSPSAETPMATTDSSFSVLCSVIRNLLDASLRSCIRTARRRRQA